MHKEQKLNVLISHSWMDKLHAEKLSKALDGLCNIWMDYRKLRVSAATKNDGKID